MIIPVAVAAVFILAVTFYFKSPTTMINSIKNIVSPNHDPKIIAVVDEATIYMEHLDEYFPMGTLLKDEIIHSIAKTTDWYVVEWGNGTGFIKSTDMAEIDKGKVKQPTRSQNSDTTIYTIEDTLIYTSDAKDLVPFGQIDAGFRYPVIGEYGDNWWEINVGSRKGYIAKKSAPVDQGVPVLMYHHILTPEEKADSPFAEATTTMTTLEFEEQMKYLHDEQYTTIKTEDLQAYLNREKNLPAKAILLTMDDGNISSRIYGYPILQKYGLHIDQYMITDRTPDEPGEFDHQTLTFLSQEEMDNMVDHYGFHGHTHTLHRLTDENVGFLLEKTDEEILEDLAINRERLNNTPYLAYPFGQYDEHVIELAKKSGFELAFTTTGGYTTLNVNHMTIPRFGIEPNVTLPEYIDKVKLPTPLRKTPIAIPSVQAQ